MSYEPEILDMPRVIVPEIDQIRAERLSEEETQRQELIALRSELDDAMKNEYEKKNVFDRKQEELRTHTRETERYVRNYAITKLYEMSDNPVERTTDEAYGLYVATKFPSTTQYEAHMQQSALQRMLSLREELVEASEENPILLLEKYHGWSSVSDKLHLVTTTPFVGIKDILDRTELQVCVKSKAEITYDYYRVKENDRNKPGDDEVVIELDDESKSYTVVSIDDIQHWFELQDYENEISEREIDRYLYAIKARKIVGLEVEEETLRTVYKKLGHVPAIQLVRLIESEIQQD